MIKVAILDDHEMVLQGLKIMLEDSMEIEVIATYNKANLLIESIENEFPDILLLDINLPDANGIELCKKLLTQYKELSIIGVSNYSDTGFIKNMIRNGAKGYLLKNTKKVELVQAILEVSRGKVYLPDGIKDILLNESLGQQSNTAFVPKLTRREKEVLTLIAEECTNTEIADQLCISIKTVESHRNNLIQKLNVRNTAGLIRTAMDKGLIG
ncbi:MAG: response regulator transcription factor [Bacteroidota bacterium]